ncbi:MAG: amino acid permease [Candidatus Micrarchaeota archaeon]|nr:amino acid permease [Candidatus Micrarchaeota archaeon]
MPLKRDIGLLEATIYGIGLILGAGIYTLIGEAAGEAGNALWLSFVLAAFIACLTGLSYAELSSRFPRAGAEFVFARKAFRNSFIPFMVGYLTIATGVVSAATVALGFGGYFSAVTGVEPIVAAGVLIVLLSYLNYRGIKESSYMNIVFTAVELFGLLFIIFIGLPYLGSVDYFEAPSITGIFTAAVLIFFAYLGFEEIANIAEETKRARRAVPLAIIISIAVTTLVYVLVALSSISVVPWEEFSRSSAPLAEVSERAVPGSSGMFSIIALFATANTVLILLIVTSRMLYGMSRNGVFPKKLSRVHPKRGTPYLSVFLVGALSLLFIGFNIGTVAEITNLGVFLIFLSVNVSLILIRLRKGFGRGFTLPLNIGRFPVIPAIGAVFCVYMLTFFSLEALIVNAVIIGFGTILYFLALRLRAERRF